MNGVNLNKKSDKTDLKVQISMREFTQRMFLRLAKRELNKDEYILATYYYSKLLNLKIHLGMFVHTNGKNKLISKPQGYEKWLAKHRPGNRRISGDCLEYFYADKKIIYAGFRVVDDITVQPIKSISIAEEGFFISINTDIEPVYIKFGSHQTIVEHLEFMDLQLSRNAIKQIFN
ncbi:hypothetical protein KFE94_17775 [bacterium SCSIO 12643]|nr:hypothetical protein KFE94_17775 [bacterium SCSIO 12643]